MGRWANGLKLCRLLGHFKRWVDGFKILLKYDTENWARGCHSSFYCQPHACYVMSNRCLLHCDVVTRHLNAYSKISICGYIKLTVAVFNSGECIVGTLLCGCV